MDNFEVEDKSILNLGKRIHSQSQPESKNQNIMKKQKTGDMPNQQIQIEQEEEPFIESGSEAGNCLLSLRDFNDNSDACSMSEQD